MNDHLAPREPQSAGQQSTTQWATSDGTRIQSRQWLATKPRATLLLIHGMGDHSGRFGHVAQYLNTQRISVLAPDLRGHGRSDGQRGHIHNFETLLSDLDIALAQTRRLAPGKPCFIYGHSLGGTLAILHTLERQTELAGLIASSPALRIAMQAPAWKLQLG
ncbi:MAG: alpha/beta fold hydrolase, partial [Pirellulaceae bacterium]|nr:alpha/beta fold hydrolase [Pirellulaceae bacterium]